MRRIHVAFSRTRCSRSIRCAHGSRAPTKPVCSSAFTQLATRRSRRFWIFYDDVSNANGPRDRRLRIEHAQHIAPKDFDRFAALSVIASVQPYQAIDDGRWAERRIGPERVKTTYAFRTLLDKKVRLALGTDWPVAPLNPMLTLYAAVTRATLDGKNPNGWVPEQKITLQEAMTAHTAGSAYAEFQEKEKGTITRGKLADVVILSDDIFSIPPAAIKDVTVVTTIVGGKVVYQR